MMRTRTATKLIALFLVSAAVSLSGCRPQSASDDAPESVRKAVLGELEQYYADFSNRDWDAYSSHFWPGATLATVWQPPGEDEPRVVILGIDEFVAQAHQGPGSREIFEERMVEAEVKASGNLAQVWARYDARFGDPGDVDEWSGIDAFTLIEHDGEWRIISLSYAGTEGEGPEAD